jgi:hypothetical protein
LASAVLPGQDLQRLLTDCIVFYLDPVRPTPNGIHPGFNDRQKADLAAIFGSNLGYETHIRSFASIVTRGRVYFVHVPGRRESLAWSEGPVPGFFPHVARGRLPGARGEALVHLGTLPDGSLNPTIEDAPRVLGQEFKPSALDGIPHTIVGLTDSGSSFLEHIYVTEIPREGTILSRAGAVLAEPGKFDEVVARLVEAGVSWHAIRVRNHRRDESWQKRGSRAEVFRFERLQFYSRDGKTIMSLSFGSSLEDPVPVADFAFELDGKPLSGTFSGTESRAKAFLDRGVIVGSVKIGAHTVMGLGYQWQTEIPPGGAEQRVSIRIKGALVAVRYTH